MNKKVLILGAGVYQVPLIKKVKEMGHQAIVVSRNGNYPGFQYADKIYYEDTTNIDKILEIAKQEGIHAAVTTGTDVTIPTIGEINSTLGLTGVSKQAAIYSTDKFEMKNKFEDFNVRSAKFRKVFNFDQAISAFNELNKPVIFKAVDSSGSRGIVRVDQECEIENAVNEVFNITKKPYFIVEEFILGKEIGAQAFILEDTLLFVLVHDDEVFLGNTAVPIGHSAPLYVSEKLSEDIKEQVKLIVNSLQLNNCAINLDFIVKDEKVYVLEVGARAGATCLPELVSITYGIDYYKFMVDVALGENPNYNPKNNYQANASLLLYAEQDGIITDLINENNMSDSNIVDISFDYVIGDRVNKFKVGPDRIGQIIVKGRDVVEAKSILTEVRNKIKIVIQGEK